MKFKLSAKPKTVRKIEDGKFDTIDILMIIWTTVKQLKDKASVILWSSFVLMLFWGLHGDLSVLKHVFKTGWIETLTFHLKWGEQLASFVVGFILLVVIPCLIIKFYFKSSLREFGLGLPSKVNRRKAWVAFSSLLVGTSLFVLLASFDSGIQREYPLFVQRAADGSVAWTITRGWEFAAFELVYLLFFITIEFAFRGYLLFGLHSIQYSPRVKGAVHAPVLRFGLYAVLIQMLAYTTWHYGKPVPEMVGTLVWGICVAAIALRIRSIWPIIISHWLYNVFLDWMLWKGIPKKILNFIAR